MLPMPMSLADSATQSGEIGDARSFFDGSGWTVSTGQSTKATGGARAQGTDAFGEVPNVPGTTFGGLNSNTLVIAVAALVCVALVMKKRG